MTHYYVFIFESFSQPVVLFLFFLIKPDQGQPKKTLFFKPAGVVVYITSRIIPRLSLHVQPAVCVCLCSATENKLTVNALRLVSLHVKPVGSVCLCSTFENKLAGLHAAVTVSRNCP